MVIGIYMMLYLSCYNIYVLYFMYNYTYIFQFVKPLTFKKEGFVPVGE
jgi:hypothetical protein